MATFNEYEKRKNDKALSNALASAKGRRSTHERNWRTTTMKILALTLIIIALPILAILAFALKGQDLKEGEYWSERAA